MTEKYKEIYQRLKKENPCIFCVQYDSRCRLPYNDGTYFNCSADSLKMYYERLYLEIEPILRNIYIKELEEENGQLKAKVSNNEWHYTKDGDLPRQDGHTCFSIEVLASNKKWVYYEFGSGKWFCGNKEVKVTAWREIIFPKDKK